MSVIAIAEHNRVLERRIVRVDGPVMSALRAANTTRLTSTVWFSRVRWESDRSLSSFARGLSDLEGLTRAERRVCTVLRGFLLRRGLECDENGALNPAGRAFLDLELWLLSYFFGRPLRAPCSLAEIDWDAVAVTVAFTLQRTGQARSADQLCWRRVTQMFNDQLERAQ